LTVLTKKTREIT